MESEESKIDEQLIENLQRIADEDVIDVLVYPRRLDEDFKNFLLSEKTAGRFEYNVLEFANCAAIRAKKKVILDISRRDDVTRVASNPRFTTHK